ncbi:alpha/beta hydrolase fold domain containing protein [Mucor ambiguus]|uniref:Alpha/beta hydrolase fold domain containing protein n=1 Tax=Mucor ambiguus TaxID=91626 RepID=A0A0C9M730_9FUNG|nr:alpha/beta hydrolase fold domain containing protein [Mucor ambiguus]
MNSIRARLRKLPPKAVIKLLRKVFSLPAPAARMILNDITRARKCHLPWIHRVKLNPHQSQDWSGCWIGENVQKLDEQALLKRIQEADIILFYVHGGGFRIGSCTMYMDTNIAWIQVLKEKYDLNAMIMSIDYKLAPEYKYPSPVEDVVRAYEHLIQKLGINSEKVIVIGDSAGAALSLEMLFITHDPSMFEIVTEDDDDPTEAAVLQELPRPAGTILISPLVTDETTSESWKHNQKYDYITQYTAKVIKKDYLEPAKKGQEPQQQVLGIAKLKSGFQAFMSPQVLMYIGNLEVLRDDALQLAMKAEQDGVAWQTVIEDFVHDWFCVREVVKDKEALRKADDIFADFCYSAIGGSVHQNRPYASSRREYTPTPRDSLLEAVKEEASDEEEDYDSDSTPSTTSVYDDFRLSKLSIFEHSNSSSQSDEVATQTPPTNTSSKRSSDIVFV